MNEMKSASPESFFPSYEETVIPGP